MTSATPSLASGSAWLCHFDRVQRALEFFLLQDLFLARNFANRAPGLRTLFCNICGAIITNLRRKTGHHCHGKPHSPAAPPLIRHDAAHPFLAETIAYVRQQAKLLEKTVDHHWHHHVELEIA